jgi:hypothetical protein
MNADLHRQHAGMAGCIMEKQREPLPFDVQHFKKLADRGIRFSTGDVFTQIYRTNHWGGNASKSGRGSDGNQTGEVAAALRRIVTAHEVRILLDLPCGDFNWMKNAGPDVARYIGGDIVPEVVSLNREIYGNREREFVVLDITAGPLPHADLLFTRDCMVHLSNDDIMKALDVIRGSGIRYLLTTTFTECDRNEDIVTGDWRIINLEKPPFSLPPPIEVINEKCTEGGGTYADKSLGLWRIADL